MRLCVTLLACAAAAAAPAAEPPERREAALLSDAGLHPALQAALADVVAVHEDLYRRGLMRPEPDLESNTSFFSDFLGSLPEDVLAELRRATRDSDTICRMILHRAGARAFRTAADGEDIGPQDLLALIEPRFLAAPPAVECATWEEKQRAIEQHSGAGARSVPEIGNLSARYLLWGALQDPELWKRHDKEEFLAVLLGSSPRHPLTRVAVETALAPPLRSAGPGVAEPLTIAGSLDGSRGRVGFTAGHLEIVDALLESLQEERVFRRPGATDPEAAEDADLPAFAARLRRQIAQELFPDAPALGRDGTLPEALQWWEERLRGSAWPAWWREARSWIEDSLRRRAAHPLDAQIDALATRLAPNDAEREELARLRAARDADQQTVAKHLLHLLAENAPPDRATAELLAIPELLAATGQGHREEGWLRMPLMAVAARDVEAARAALHAGLADPHRRLPEVARASFVMGCQLRPDAPGVLATLERVAREGGGRERGVALVDTSAFPPATARALFEKALEDCAPAPIPTDDAHFLRGGLLNGLRARHQWSGDEDWALAIAVRGLESGALSVASARSWDANLLWLLRELPEAERARLAARGLLPADARRGE